MKDDRLARPKYTKIINGRLHWAPPQWARRLNFNNRALGPDSHAARAAAEELNRELEAARAQRNGPKLTLRYPEGSLGHFFCLWKTSEAYARKGPRSREELEIAWKRIGPALGSHGISKIGPSDIERFQVQLEEGATEYVRWRTIKKLRQILNAAVAYGVIDRSPALTLPNPQPAPRTGILTFDQVHALIAAARETGAEGLSLAIRIMYETAVAPIDARSVTAAMLKPDRMGGYLERPRSKTRAPIQAGLSSELWHDLMAYRDARPAVLPDAPILRRANGAAWPAGDRGRRAFNYDFAQARKAAGLDPGLKALDIRRTVNLEAALGGADPEARATLLANNMHRSARLEATYTPPTVAASRELAAKRAIGRDLIAREKIG